jgi:hypothetical protein
MVNGSLLVVAVRLASLTVQLAFTRLAWPVPGLGVLLALGPHSGAVATGPGSYAGPPSKLSETRPHGISQEFGTRSPLSRYKSAR